MPIEPCHDAVCCWRILYYVQQRYQTIAQIFVLKLLWQLTDTALVELSLRIEIVFVDEIVERLN